MSPSSKSSSLNELLKPVIDSPPVVSVESEVEVLHELPTETLYLALKEADAETSLWFFENALPEQVQGLVDIDCWDGSEFLPDRFEEYFKNISLLSPLKIAEYMKQLDPEVVVRGLLDLCDVQDYDPQNPPELEDDHYLLTLDNKYLLVLKKKSPDIKESLFQWINKFSAANIELLRRHLESCKWEVASDLEEFGYRIKKGRLEEMGFVDYHEAIALYGFGQASALKKEMLASPLGPEEKFPPDLLGENPISDSENPQLLPRPISKSVWGEGFIRDCLGKVSNPKHRRILIMELLRTVNASLAADRVLHESLALIEEASTRARRYLELGLLYLCEGDSERGAKSLLEQPLDQVYRLGWLTISDLSRAAREIKTQYGTQIFGDIDSRILMSFADGRHPSLDSGLEKDLEIAEFPSFPSVLKVGSRLAELSALAHYVWTELEATLAFQSRPLVANESMYSRLLALLFRQASGGSISSGAITTNEWTEFSSKVDWVLLDKSVSLIAERMPERARALFAKRLKEHTADLRLYIESNPPTKIPDTRFFKSLIIAK
jgi:hypothetical protein